VRKSANTLLMSAKGEIMLKGENVLPRLGWGETGFGWPWEARERTRARAFPVWAERVARSEARDRLWHEARSASISVGVSPLCRIYANGRTLQLQHS